MKFYDAHNHLHDIRLDGLRDEVMASASAKGIDRFVVNGTSGDDWERLYVFAKEHKSVIPSFGLHPWYVAKRAKDWEEKLRYYLDKLPAGVGEVGLDKWMQDYDLKEQETVLRVQIALSAERNLPLSIHCLKAWGHLLDVLRDVKLPECGFLLHSYGGSAEVVNELVRLGAYFSFSGYFMHSRKEKLWDVFRAVPLERLLIETDSPDMCPPVERNTYPLADNLNHPSNLVSIYEFVAGLRQMEIGEFSEQVECNFEKLFGGVIV